jgi:hypothetical protein
VKSVLRSHCSTDRDRSVCEVTSADTYINNAPVPGVSTTHGWGRGLRYALRDVPQRQPYLDILDTSNSLLIPAIYVDMVRKLLRCICINCSLPHRRRQHHPLAQGQRSDSTWPRRNVSGRTAPPVALRRQITWDKQAKMTMVEVRRSNEAVTRAMFASDIDAIFSRSRTTRATPCTWTLASAQSR